MIRHWMRLIWNRKRANFLIMIEIFVSFLVLEGVMLVAAQYIYNYRHPLGFSIENVWMISLDPKSADDPAARARNRETAGRLLQTVRDMPEVVSAAGTMTPPYDNSSWVGAITTHGRTLGYGVNQVTDVFRDVFSVDLRRGRWFSHEDDAAADRPVVINERFAREIFGEVDPIGRTIPRDPEPTSANQDPEPPPKPMRVIGVVGEFRQHGEFSMLDNYAFQRNNLDDATSKMGMPNRIAIKVRPGTTVTFEEQLTRQLQSVAREWSFEVKRVDDMRSDTLQTFLTPAIILGTIAGFLLLMAALGLTGVVWQNVTQRVREIGLRRAKGARIEDIHRQILGELAVMTSFALAVAVALVAQMPLLPLPHAVFAMVDGTAFTASVGISVLTIYGLTIGCGWYPARLATRIQPAEALHYE